MNGGRTFKSDVRPSSRWAPFLLRLSGGLPADARFTRACRALAYSLALVALGCGDDGGGGGDDGPAGAGAGGSGSRECSDAEDRDVLDDFEACGGDPEGRWRVASIVFENPEVLLVGGLLEQAACADARSGTEICADGEYRFGAGGEFTVDVAFSVTFELHLDSECLLDGVGSEASDEVCNQIESEWSLDPNLVEVTCRLVDEACDCALTTADNTNDSEGAYEVDGDIVSIGDNENPFCVDGDRLALSITRGGLSGLVVMERDE